MVFLWISHGFPDFLDFPKLGKRVAPKQLRGSRWCLSAGRPRANPDELHVPWKKPWENHGKDGKTMGQPMVLMFSN